MKKKSNTSKMISAIEELISPVVSEEPDNLSWHDMRTSKKNDGENDCLVGIMDAANVALIYPKNENSYNLLKSVFRNNKDGWCRVPQINYNTELVSKSKYAIDYLERFIKLAKVIDSGSVTLVMGKDTPINFEIENDDYSFGLILAPRVDGD